MDDTLKLAPRPFRHAVADICGLLLIVLLLRGLLLVVMGG